MKKITLLLLITCTAMFVKAQGTLDFEDGGKGANLPWKDLANKGVAPTIISNPKPGPGNYSDKVLHLPLQIGGNSWAGTWVEMDQFTVTNTGLVRMSILKPSSSPTGCKFESNGSAGGTGLALELKVTNNTVDEWETLEWDFSDRNGQTYSKLVIMPHFTDNPRSLAADVYVDDIEFFPTATPLSAEKHTDTKVYNSNNKVIYKSSYKIDEAYIVNIGGDIVIKDTNLNGEINIESLQRGIYIVAIEANGVTSTFKIIKK